VVKGVPLGNVSSAGADDGNHFAFIVKLRRNPEANDRGSATDEAGSESREDCGIVGHREAALDGVIDIVEPNANDLSGS